MGVPTGAKFMAYVGHRGEKREKQKREREQRFASISKRRFYVIRKAAICTFPGIRMFGCALVARVLETCQNCVSASDAVPRAGPEGPSLSERSRSVRLAVAHTAAGQGWVGCADARTCAAARGHPRGRKTRPFTLRGRSATGPQCQGCQSGCEVARVVPRGAAPWGGRPCRAKGHLPPTPPACMLPQRP